MTENETTQEKVERFYALFEEIQVLANDKREAMSKVEKELSAIYHVIEGVNIKHVSESHNLIKRLKVVLQRRRDTKVDDNTLRSIVTRLGSGIGDSKTSYYKTLNKHADMVEEIRVRAIEKK